MINKIIRAILFCMMLILDVIVIIATVTSCLAGYWMYLPIYILAFVMSLCVTYLALTIFTED